MEKKADDPFPYTLPDSVVKLMIEKSKKLNANLPQTWSGYACGDTFIRAETGYAYKICFLSDEDQEKNKAWHKLSTKQEVKVTVEKIHDGRGDGLIRVSKFEIVK